MAYQPKSYKKFVATAATATLVATAVVPAAFADDVTTAAFTDVAPQYKAAVDFVVEQAIAKGISETQFGISKEIIRGDAAIMIANAAKLNDPTAPASGFTDVPTRGALAINSLKAAGVTNGKTATSFDFSGSITRGEAAVFLANAFNLEGDVSNVKFTDVNSRYMAAVAALVEEKVTSGKTATQFGTDDNITRGEFARWIYALEEYIVDKETSPTVSSVSAINANQIVVNFNTELNDDKSVFGDASEAALYTLDGKTASSAVLSDDNKSVTLTFSDDVEGIDQVLVVDTVATNAKDEDGEWIFTEKFSTVLSYTDTVAPAVLSTSYSNDIITVQFSEALGKAPNVVRVNGVPVTTGISIDSSDNTKVNIAYAGLAAGSTASLYLAGAEDASVAANEMALFNGTVIAPTADTGKPQITSVQVTGQNTARVTLSEDIVGETIAANLQQGATVTSVTLNRDVTDTTGKTYTLSVPNLFSTGTATSETFNLLVAKDVMADANGNKNNEFVTSLTFVKDTVAPALLSTSLTTGNQQFAFSFNEALTVAGLDSNIVVKNSDGVKIAVIDGETALKSDDAKVYLVDTVAGENAIAPGTYTVTLPSGFFKDQYGNVTSAITSTFTVGTGTGDTTKPVASVSTPATNKFQVAFYNGTGGAETVTGSALNLSNYKLDGKALPSGTDIYFTSTSKNTVEIVLPTNSVNISAPGILTVANVQDVAGNVLNTSNHTVTLTDNTAATIQSVQVIGAEVFVTFNENLNIDTTDDANTVFDVKVNGVEAEAGSLAPVAGNAKQVKFTLSAAPTATPVVTVKANQTDLTDANNVPVK